MNVDRRVFLALTLAIAGATTAGCSGGDDGTGSSEGAATVVGSRCINPATEEGPSAEGASAVLDFDPVGDFSAAEGFCFDRVFGKDTSDKNVLDTAHQQIYMKCNSYAKLYVPWTVRDAYQQIKRSSTSGTLTFAMLYAIDKRIVGDQNICPSSAATQACAAESDKTGCTLLASQMKPEQQSQLLGCMNDKHFDAFTCAEGFGALGAPGAAPDDTSCFIHPATEAGPTAEGSSGVLQFDPVNDFPAAESFCADRVFGSDRSDANVLDSANQQKYMKCNSYAKLYLPWTVREAYQQIERNSASGALDFPTMYAIDKRLVGDTTICFTTDAESVCANEKDKASCLTLASQMTPAAQTKLTACTDGKGFDVFTCAEGLFLD